MRDWKRFPGNLYESPVPSRTLIVWLAFMAMLWAAFAAGLVTHPDAWANVPPVERETGWSVFQFILRNNFLIAALILAGNIFVRFGTFTPGLVVLGIQAVLIGWTAGTNGFLEPFPSLAAANEAFLRIGLWETTAYALLCSVTIDKSLLIADTFPATKWTESRTWKEIRFTTTEIVVSVLAVLSLLCAAYVEAFLPL
jgi:hypothetical protein